EATVCLAEGRPDDAAGLASVSADGYRELSMPIELVRALLVGAEAERRRRRRAAARSLLEEALATSRSADATPWIDRISTELARLAPVPQPGEPVLTPIEERIVAMVVAGATNREIATRVAISVSTVEAALTKIYR